MGIQVKVILKGPHIKDISIVQGENSLTVNLMDWWKALTEVPVFLPATPGAEMEVGEYRNMFSGIFNEEQPKNTFPLFGETEVSDFQDNVKHLKELGYRPPVLKGRYARCNSSQRIFNDGWCRQEP